MSKYGSVLGLDTIRGLLRELGNPQDDLKFIHIAGTNGKGSVLAYTSTILSEAGYRTGRYVSPTVVSYLERIQIDGKWIPEDEFAELVEEVKKAIARMEARGEASPTVFEAETAVAFFVFQREALRLSRFRNRAGRPAGCDEYCEEYGACRIRIHQQGSHGISGRNSGGDCGK